MKIVTVEQMQRLEQACAPLGISIDRLMENAGLAVARQSRIMLGTVPGTRVLVLVGSGNNGADGLVAARHLQRWGAQVTAYAVAQRPSENPKMAMAAAEGINVAVAAGDTDLKSLDRELARCRLVIDAVLGTGRARPMDGAVKDAMLHLGEFRRVRGDMKVLALDLPSGLDANTGETDPACPKADLTIALGFPKVGHLKFPGAERVGLLEISDIGIPGHLAEDIDLELLTARSVAPLIPRRPLNSHKGTFGHALVIAGSRFFVGASYLAAQAAARTGAGLVTAAAPRGIYPMLSAKLTEVVHLPLPEDEGGMVHADAAGIVRGNAAHYNAMLVGCGMGRSEGARLFIEELLLRDRGLDMPTLIDADGLNNLSEITSWWDRLKAPVVLTPHPGEMSTLTGISTADIQGDRIGAARKWSSRWGVTVVLKGAYTVVADPQGVCYVSPFANPGLASGGTGDVLAGTIAGLMAQGKPPTEAALAGVYVHGLAGETVRSDVGESGMLAGDLLDKIPHILSQLRGNQ